MKIEVVGGLRRGQRWPRSYSRFQDFLNESVARNRARRIRNKIITFSLIFIFLFFSFYKVLDVYAPDFSKSFSHSISNLIPENLKDFLTGRISFGIPEEPSSQHSQGSSDVPDQPPQAGTQQPPLQFQIPELPSPEKNKTPQEFQIPELPEENETQQEQPQAEEIQILSEDLTQQAAEINKPVKWTLYLKLNKEANSFKLKLPIYASNIRIKETKSQSGMQFGITAKVIKEQGGFPFFKKIFSFFSRITGLAAEETQDINLNFSKLVKEVEIEYETPAPISTENIISDNPYKKQIKISSELHYNSVFAYTNIPESNQGDIYFYLIENGKQNYNASFIDTNNNGLIDRLEWTTDLSEKTFEVSISGGFGIQSVNLSTCANLSTENEIYTLYNDVNSTVTCMQIDANNVTLDCQGYLINYSTSAAGYAVNVSGYNFTTIRNCKIVQGSNSTDSHSITFSNANNGSIQNNSITTYGTNSNSIYIYSSSNSNNITDNIIYNPGTGEGITIQASNLTIINNNNVTVANKNAINISSSSNSGITNNIISASGPDGYNINGIFSGSSPNTSVINNTITCNANDGNGVYLYSGSSNSNIINNTITTSGSDNWALALESTSDSNFIGNTVFSNESWDFHSLGKSNSQNNIVTDLHLRSANVSFNFLDIALRAVTSRMPADSGGLYNISKYLNISSTSASAWAFINISYNDDELVGVNETTLKLYRYNSTSTAWELIIGSGVNTAANYVYGNTTPFCIFAPMGALAIQNIAPAIPFVESISAQNPVESSYRDVTFKFMAQDSDGYSDLNDSSALAKFTRAGETARSASCTSVGGEADGEYKNYTCTVQMWYWDGAGAWDVNVSIADVNAARAENNTANFTYNQLTAIVISPSTVNWPQILPGDANKTASDFTTINNTGNAVISSGNVRVKAINLYGQTNPAHLIYAENFTSSVYTGGSPPAECSGDQLENGTFVSITGSALPKGNLSAGGGTAQEQLYYCLIKASSSLIKQIYSTTVAGAWYIDIVSALAIIIPARKKRKLKQIQKGLLEAVYGLIYELKDKYNISSEELFELIKSEQLKLKEEKEINIPISIFSIKEMGPAESIVKYLKENLGLRFSEIAKILNRDDRTIWITYRNAQKKMKAPVKTEKILKDKMQIPVSALSDRRLSILESVVNFLKEKKFANAEIAEILDKDPRNIHTFYARVKKKLLF